MMSGCRGPNTEILEISPRLTASPARLSKPLSFTRVEPLKIGQCIVNCWSIHISLGRLEARRLDPHLYPMCTRGQFRDHGLSPRRATGPDVRDLQRGAPGEIRTRAPASGGRCSIP